MANKPKPNASVTKDKPRAVAERIKNPTKTWWGRAIVWLIIIGMAVVPVVSLIVVLIMRSRNY